MSPDTEPRDGRGGTLKSLALGLAALMLPLGAAADEIFLKSGGQLSGRIVSRSATAVEIDVGAGRIAVPASSVVRIEEGRSALQEYEERAGRIAPGDVGGWVALGEWASSRGLGSQAREAYNRARSAAPNDPRANQALGNVQMDGRWMSEDDAYRAKGYVQFEGEWMTPAEHDAILRERESEARQERERQEADVRTREAEARAQEAEARARKAEAEAAESQSSSEGLPLWYGWGAGPVVWPSGPIITPQPFPSAKQVPVPR
jgi:hypothetical protein